MRMRIPGVVIPRQIRRDRRVKKDILATITFLLTGLIFFLTQLESTSKHATAFGNETRAVETVSAEASSGAGVLEFLPEDFRS